MLLDYCDPIIFLWPPRVHTPLAIHPIVHLEQLCCELFQAASAGSPDTEESIVFSCLLDLIEAVALNELLLVLLIRAYS